MTHKDIQNQAACYIADVITARLAKDQAVLWLVSGGSAIETAILARTMINISESMKLHVGLVDERFGPIGHDDSNFKQLLGSGFDTNNILLLPLLTENKTITETSLLYNDKLIELLKTNHTIGLFGIGIDGHTAGILPKSPLVNKKIA